MADDGIDGDGSLAGGASSPLSSRSSRENAADDELGPYGEIMQIALDSMRLHSCSGWVARLCDRWSPPCAQCWLSNYSVLIKVELYAV
jgi:hypothetical protein